MADDEPDTTPAPAQQEPPPPPPYEPDPDLVGYERRGDDRPRSDKAERR